MSEFIIWFSKFLIKFKSFLQLKAFLLYDCVEPFQITFLALATSLDSKYTVNNCVMVKPIWGWLKKTCPTCLNKAISRLFVLKHTSVKPTTPPFLYWSTADLWYKQFWNYWYVIIEKV